MAPASGSVCASHDKMLGKTEFRQVVTACFIIFSAISSIIYYGSASKDSVVALDRRVEDEKRVTERREQAKEKRMDKMEKQLSDIHSFLLRNGPSDVRYGGRIN